MSSVNFYYHTNDFYNDIFKAIKDAKKSVYLESYIFEYFSSTQTLIELLSQAQLRGIEVKVILDGFGSFHFLKKHLTNFESHNIDFRVFNPLPYPFNNWQRAKRPFSIFQILKIGNRRNHRKLVIIDEKTVFLGSQNWSIHHIENPANKTPWQDIGCRVEDENTEELINSFRQIWKTSKRKNSFRPFKGFVRLKNHNPLSSHFKLNFSFIQRYRIYKLLMKKIKTSQKSITIGSAYFIPKRYFIRALKKAKKRGIDVTIITSGPTDIKIVKLAAQGLYEKLLQVNIPIFEYSKTHFHSKYFLFDDESLLIGSYNMNHRSLMHDLELLYEITTPAKIAEFKLLIDKDIQDSTRLSLEHIKNRPWYVKLISKVLYRIRYIL